MNAKAEILYSWLFIFLLVLVRCNNHGLLDKIENPGSTGKTGSGSGNGSAAIYLFRTNTTFNGDLATAGGTPGNARAGSDSLCSTARGGITFPDNSCMNVRAFISISAADEIQDMPANYGVPVMKPIQSLTGVLVDSDWANLLTQPIAPSGLAAAGVMPVSTYWWSFSNSSNGTFDGTNNCTNGTVSTSVPGRRGFSDSNILAWMTDDLSGCNVLPAYVLCLCY
ncbi:MAG: hypothetical protein JNJ69_14415 [Leptospiraceae bacterium]|nr:hypothetical protein [Leptospiraceae bacterium]